ncbi:MAG: hypothetical protein WAM97_16250 [Acidimicrobiales bacterium]|jgi:hypothetical protein
MNRRKWFDSSQPQTLQIAVILLYINAVFGVIDAFGSLYLLPILLEGLCGFGIANEKRIGYIGAIILSAVFAVLALTIFVIFGGFGALLNVLFSVALVALLVHPMSRDYQKIWFK